MKDSKANLRNKISRGGFHRGVPDPMSSRYGRYVAALGGLGLLTAILIAVTWVWGSPGAPPEPAKQARKAPSDEQYAGQIGCDPRRLATLPLNESTNERRRCAEARDQRANAQDAVDQARRSADASERGVVVAYRQARSGFVQAVATVGALMAAIAAAVAAAWAAYYAKRAADIAEEQMIAARRGYLATLDFQLAKAWIHLPDGQRKVGYRIEIPFLNAGVTPVRVSRFIKAERQVASLDEVASIDWTLNPNLPTSTMIVGPNATITSEAIQWTAEELRESFYRQKFYLHLFRIEYGAVVGRDSPHHTQIAFRIDVQAHPTVQYDKLEPHEVIRFAVVRDMTSAS